MGMHGANEMVADEKTLIFLHIGKTAGSSLHRIIERQFPSENIHTFDDDDIQKCMNRFMNLPEEERRKIRCLKGHMPFGVHRWLPGKWSYMTMLRLPVERVISNYYYIRSIPEHTFYDIYVPRCNSLEDFVKLMDERGETNFQTRCVAAFGDFDNVMPPYDPLPREALDIAKQNLSTQFDIVGLVEHFDESLVLMKELFGWGRIFYTKENVTSGRKGTSEIPRRTIEFIEKFEELDMELYALGKQIFEGLIDKQGASFKGKVERFKKLNKLYGIASRNYHRLGRVKRSVKTSVRSMLPIK